MFVHIHFFTRYFYFGLKLKQYKKCSDHIADCLKKHLETHETKHINCQLRMRIRQKINWHSRKIHCLAGALHRDAFCQLPFRWIYYCHSSKSTGKETGKTHLCALDVQCCWLNVLKANAYCLGKTKSVSALDSDTQNIRN